MLQRLFERYSGRIRSLKAVYVANNLLHAARLAPNRALYKKLGLRKSIFAPIGANDFPSASQSEMPWLDAPDALEKMERHPDFALFPPETQAELRRFIDEGYMILKGFFSIEDVASLNAEIERLRASGKASFNYTGRKIFNIHESSPVSDQVFFKNDRLLRLLAFLFQKNPVPFQTLHFIEGSEQRAHSDLMHMTTHPPGYLLAAWTALEPVGPENGTLAYWPKSHRLPFVSTTDYESGNSFFTIGQDSNKRYEDKIEEILIKSGLEPKTFEGDAGDVFVWHANLLHAGSPILKKGLTRKSMVGHYFAEGALCFHEMTQRPALLKR